MSGTSHDPRLVQGLLRLYPAGWRERYADEFAAVLVSAMEDGRRRWRVALDAAAGAADAHLHPGPRPSPDRVRNAACLAFCAFVVFCLAGSGFQRMSEDQAFTAAAHAHSGLAWSYGVVFFGAIAAALTVVAGSLPVLLAIVRQARAGRRDLARLALIPPVAAAAFLVVLIGVVRLDTAGVHSTVNIAVFVGLVVAFFVATGLSAGALVSATRRVELPAAIKRSQWRPMIGLSLAMVAVTVGDLVWGLTLRAQAPALFHSDNGVLATSLPVTWISTLVAMALASVAAVGASARAIRLARTADPAAAHRAVG